MEECRSEASIGIEYSESVHDSSDEENTNSTSVKTAAQVDSCSPSERKKRKRISPHSTPKVTDGRSTCKIFNSFAMVNNTQKSHPCVLHICIRFKPHILSLMLQIPWEQRPISTTENLHVYTVS